MTLRYMSSIAHVNYVFSERGYIAVNPRSPRGMRSIRGTQERGGQRRWGMGFLADRLRAAGDRLFCADVERAMVNGLQVRPGRFRLSRAYRDPRFDRLAECDFCHGWGSVFPGHPCVQCAGTGRMTMSEPLRDDWRLVR
jgi:hypothetical protein